MSALASANDNLRVALIPHTNDKQTAWDYAIISTNYVQEIGLNFLFLTKRGTAKQATNIAHNRIKKLIKHANKTGKLNSLLGNELVEFNHNNEDSEIYCRFKYIMDKFPNAKLLKIKHKNN